MQKPVDYISSLPYIGPICGGISPGKKIRIQATVPAIAYRFIINLQCATETPPGYAVAIQVSVRLEDGYISLNSLQNGIWDEERCGTATPIKRGEKFEIILTCDFNQYKVAINGQHYCEFPQRIHYDCITHCAIAGDLSNLQVFYESASEDGMLGISEPLALAATEMIDLPTITGPPSRRRAISSSHGAPLHDNQEESAPERINESSPFLHGAAVLNTQGESAPQNINGSSPFPKDASFSTGISYPMSSPETFTTGAPYSADAPYSIGAPYSAGAPDSIDTLGVVSTSPYLPPSAGPSSPSATYRHNVSESERHDYLWRRFCTICSGTIFLILVFLFVVFKIKA